MDVSTSLAEREQPQTLIPLQRAVAVLAARLHGPDAPAAFTTGEQLDALACALLALAPVFVAGNGAWRQLTDDEVYKARFRRSGTEIHFVDGRAPLAELAVTPQDLANVIRILASSR